MATDCEVVAPAWAIRIPKPVAQEAGVGEGDPILLIRRLFGNLAVHVYTRAARIWSIRFPRKAGSDA